MTPARKKPSIWYHICGIGAWIRDQFLEHPKTLSALLTAALSLGGTLGYTVSEVTTDPLRAPTTAAQDSINARILSGMEEIKGTMSDGFNQMADRQDSFEEVVARLAVKVGVDKEIMGERRLRRLQDSLRRNLFPREPTVDALDATPEIANYGAGQRWDIP